MNIHTHIYIASGASTFASVSVCYNTQQLPFAREGGEKKFSDAKVRHSTKLAKAAACTNTQSALDIIDTIAARPRLFAFGCVPLRKSNP